MNPSTSGLPSSSINKKLSNKNSNSSINSVKPISQVFQIKESDKKKLNTANPSISSLPSSSSNKKQQNINNSKGKKGIFFYILFVIPKKNTINLDQCNKIYIKIALKVLNKSLETHFCFRKVNYLL